MRLKELRIKRNLNMRQTALALEIPYTTYISYEKGDREPNSEMLINLADFFNCSVDYLLGRSDEQIDDSVLDKSLLIDQDILEEKGNLYDAQKAQMERDNKLSIKELFFETVTKKEIEHIVKLRQLDTHGTKIVNFVLDEEYNRCTYIAEEDEKQEIEIKHSYYKVSAGTGFDLGNDDEWETISIPDSSEARKADFALTIQGNSMEPVYFDGDIVLVKEQPAIDIGQIGIFMIEGKGYIKKYGGDRLISLNAEYDDIIFAEYDEDRIRCVGKVIGRV